jgi:predicted GH43/DUF377 family glycosyl hydrolase
MKVLKSLIALSVFHGCIVLAAENGIAQAWELGPFLRPDKINPIIEPNTNLVFDCPMNNRPVEWAALNTFNPGAVLRDGYVCVLFRSEDASGSMSIGGHTSRIGLAESSDGRHFVCRPAPVLFPAEDNRKDNEWTGGCEDPRVVEADNGMYVIMYTEYRRDSTARIARLGVATSPDLVHWDKHGPVFEKLGGDFAGHYCKSGAILTRLVNGRLIAVKYQGKYWMYWGEGEIRLANSDNLLDWNPGPVVLKTRRNKFDSALVEAGPPAVITDHGILLIYNGKNALDNGDKSLPGGVYSGGQALFDLNDPTKLIQRTDSPFFKPEADFERSGQYTAGTTFLEGLVHFHDEWLLFYGCADSYVGMATAKD